VNDPDLWHFASRSHSESHVLVLNGGRQVNIFQLDTFDDWVFSKNSPLLEDLKKHISAKTTGKLKAVREDLKLQWPRFLEDEKGEEVGYTPLHIACMFGSRESINGLFEAGANSKVSGYVSRMTCRIST